MTNKFLIAASALVLGATMSTMAFAAEAETGTLTGSGNAAVATGGYVLDHNGVAYPTAGTATANTNNTSTTTVTDNDTKTVSDTSDTLIVKDNGNRVLSGNESTKTTTINDEDTYNSAKIDADINTKYSEENNTVTKVSEDNDTTVKYSEDNDVTDKFSQDNDVTTTTVKLTLSLQLLDGTVTDNDISQGASNVVGHGGTASNVVATGGVSAGTNSNFAGIATQGYNSGLTTVNQAATGLGANSSISFQ